MSTVTRRPKWNPSNNTPPLQSLGRRRWSRLLIPVLGFLALLWFLIRVIPKPSRATYPCQRAAFPMASAFVCWLLGLSGSVVVLRRAQRQALRARLVKAVSLFGLAIGILWCTLSVTQEAPIQAAPAGDPQVANAPIGVAQGIFPGRVTWIYDPNAATWDGSDGDGDYWWLAKNTDPEAVANMVSFTVQNLAGTDNNTDAWDAMFRYFNGQRGQMDPDYPELGKPYSPSEKIMIKTNHVSGAWGATSSGLGGNWNRSSSRQNGHFTTWQLTKALLEQLIEHAGVAQEDITVGDPLCFYPREFRDPCYDVYPKVKYLDKAGGPQPDDDSDGWVKPRFSKVPMKWSSPDYGYTRQDYIPTCFTEATYMINLSNLKFHGRGAVTLCAKNHYGSFVRRAGGTGGTESDGFFDMHAELPGDMGGGPGGVTGMGHYRPLVDIMAHPDLGKKTMLCLIDGLYGANVHLKGWNGSKDTLWKYTMPPFNGRWPSSLFASMDQVAIESVGLDLIRHEYSLQRLANYAGQGPELDGGDDYLHEASQIENPPSGVFYDPTETRDKPRGGLTLTSLGVHEHWNNGIDKQYSRNLDPEKGTGIELIALHEHSSPPLSVHMAVPVGRTEAEALDMVNYEYDKYFRDGIQNARCTSQAGGQLLGTFTGPSGTYRFTVRYLDEDDGQGWLRLFIGQQWIGTKELNSLPERWQNWTLSQVRIENGDELRIEGIWHDNERGRVDYIDIQ